MRQVAAYLYQTLADCITVWQPCKEHVFNKSFEMCLARRETCSDIFPPTILQEMKSHEGVWVNTVHTFCRLCHLGPGLVSSQLFHAHIQTWSKEYKVFEPATENFGKLLSHVLLKAGRRGEASVWENVVISLIYSQKSVKNLGCKSVHIFYQTWMHWV